MTIGQRLKQEREKMQLSQAAFAAIAGASKRAQIDWEKGTSSPNAKSMSAFAEAGADILYILTGKKYAASTSQAAAYETVAETRLDEIEVAFHDSSEEFAPELTDIAKNNALTDRTRARADRILRLHGDDLAETRHHQREMRNDTDRRRARLQLDDAYRVLAWRPTAISDATFVRLIVEYDIDSELLDRLLIEMRALDHKGSPNSSASL